MKRNNVSKISAGPTNSDHSANLSKEPRNVSELTEECEISQNSPELLNEISGLEKLPDLAKKHIFRYLPLQDLKNLTVTSSKLNWDVKSLDRRFSVVSARLYQDFPVLDHFTVKRRDIKIFLHVRLLYKEIAKDELEEKFLWIRSQADKITRLIICVGSILEDLEEHYIEIVKQLLFSDLQFPGLKKVELGIIKMPADTVYNLLIKFESKIEVLKLEKIDFRNFDVSHSYDLSSLKEVQFDYMDDLYKPFKILQSVIQNLEVLRIYGDEITMPLIEQDLLGLRKLEIDTERNLVINLENFLKKCARTLTHLDLYGHYPEDPQLMSINFSALQATFIDFDEMVMKTSLIKNLLHLSALTLQCLKFQLSDIEEDIDLGINFSVLTEFAIVLQDGSDISGLLVEVINRAPNLAFFMHSSESLEFDGFDQVEHQFPAMKYVSIWSKYDDEIVQCGTGLNSFLMRCPNLETLKLLGLQVELNINLPRLTVLYANVRGSGLDKLLDSCASNLEELCINNADIPVLTSISEKGLPKLNLLMLHPRVPAWLKVDHMNLPKNVKVVDYLIEVAGRIYLY